MSDQFAKRVATVGAADREQRRAAEAAASHIAMDRAAKLAAAQRGAERLLPELREAVAALQRLGSPIPESSRTTYTSDEFRDRPPVCVQPPLTMRSPRTVKDWFLRRTAGTVSSEAQWSVTVRTQLGHATIRIPLSGESQVWATDALTDKGTSTFDGDWLTIEQFAALGITNHAYGAHKESGGSWTSVSMSHVLNTFLDSIARYLAEVGDR